MATFYGKNATRLLQDQPKQLADIGETNGRVRMLYDKFDLSAVLATTDKLLMGAKIPKGARIVDVILKSTDMGTGGDFNVGWEASEDGAELADEDGFFAAIDVNAAATKASMVANAAGNLAGLFKKFAAEVQPSITPSESGTATTGTVELAILFVID